MIGIFLFFSLLLDLVRRIIKWYFGIDDISLTPWDLLSNDYAMITQMLFIYARRNNEKGKEPLLVFIYIAI